MPSSPKRSGQPSPKQAPASGAKRKHVSKAASTGTAPRAAAGKAQAKQKSPSAELQPPAVEPIAKKSRLPEFPGTSRWLVEPHGKVRLSKLETKAPSGFSHDDVKEPLEDRLKELASLQDVLYASQTKAVLLVLQGMDTAGKDGTISHIFSGVNPQGCQVASFKVPTPLEARHDFLWRCHQQAPALGMIGVFNRSHYEQVLSPRVHGHLDKKQVRRSLEEINDWERMLVENGTLILKFFLHISKDEQTARLKSRIEDSSKHWKLSEADFKERQFWDDYQEAYQDILSHTSRKHAPWFAIPSDDKWFRNLAISEILVESLKALKLKYPKPTVDVSTLTL